MYVISLLSIQHFGKEEGRETRSAAKWSAPNCSIYCACMAALSQMVKERKVDGTLFTEAARERTLTLVIMYTLDF